MRQKLPLVDRAAYWSDIVTHVAGKTMTAVACSAVIAGLLLEYMGESRITTIVVALLGPALFTPVLAWAAYTSWRESAELKQRLRAMAQIETLPSVLNTASFINFGDRLRSIAVRQRRHLSMMTVEIKHFETIRDTLGRRRGDALIRLFAEQIVKTIRAEADIVCRVKEAKFAILLIDADYEGSRRVAQRMLNKIERADFGGTFMTAGVCIATLEPTDKSIEDFLDRTETTPFTGIESLADASGEKAVETQVAKAA